VLVKIALTGQLFCKTENISSSTFEELYNV